MSIRVNITLISIRHWKGAMMVPMLFCRRRGSCAVNLVAALLTGCINLSNNPEYPHEWAARSYGTIGSCPDIAGSYSNDGSLYIDSGILCQRNYKMGPDKGRWTCRLDLASNFGINDAPMEAIEITQPDPNTLKIELHNLSDIARKTFVLHQGEGFQCDARGIVFSGTSGTLPFTHSKHSRSLFPDKSGALVMKVHDVEFIYSLVMGAAYSGTSYVRWKNLTPNRSKRSQTP